MQLGPYRISMGEESRLFSAWCGAVVVAVLLGSSSAQVRAQQANLRDLPDAPGYSASSLQATDAANDPAVGHVDGPVAPATIAGTVLDTNDNVVEGARLVLTGPSGQRVLESGANGQFSFAGLAPGSYKLTISGGDVSTWESPAIVVQAGETRYLSKLVLALNAGVTEVRVTANQEEIAEEEIHVEESQRVLGIVPNFYSAYDWNAPPLNARQKFALAFRSEIDPMTFAGAAAVAGAEEYQKIYPGYGTGLSGFGKRFAAQYANDFDSRMIGSALLPSLFRQDPRYFYKGTGSVRSRAWYAVKSSVICRGDNGHNEIDFSHIGGDMAAGTLANLYYPEKNEGVGLVFVNTLIEIGGMAGTNLLREFLLRDITSHTPPLHMPSRH